jgi:hypothetical protein
MNLNRNCTIGIFLFIPTVIGIAKWAGYEPAVALLVCVLALIGIVCAWKVQIGLMAGLLFVGSFKLQGASEVSLRDPTLLLLVLLVIAVLGEVLFRRLSNYGLSPGQTFSGEASGLLGFLALLSIVVISYLYTPAPISGLIKLGRFVAFVPIVFLSPLLFLRSEKNLKSFIVINLILSLVLAFRSVLELMHSSPVAMELAGKTDITRIGDAQLIGATLVTLLYYRFTERFTALITTICVPVLIAGLIACAARGPLASLFFAVVVGLIAIRKGGHLPRRAVLIGLVLGVVVAVLATLWIEKFPAARDKFMHKESELALLSQWEAPGGTAGQRLQFYSRAWEGFKQKPIFGWGLGAWVTYYYGYDSTTAYHGTKIAFLTDYPHNIILEVAFEQGIVGLSALIALLAIACSRVIRLLKTADGRYAFMCPLFLYCLSAGMFSDDINNRVLWTWCGTVFAVSRLAIQEAAESSADQITAWTGLERPVLSVALPASTAVRSIFGHSSL